nr:MAG TPA: hypothetical protein [Caudoviricetes sp.]
MTIDDKHTTIDDKATRLNSRPTHRASGWSLCRRLPSICRRFVVTLLLENH